MPMGKEVNFDMTRALGLWDWVWRGESAGQDVARGGSEQPDDSQRALGPWKLLKKEKSFQLNLGHVCLYFFLGPTY